MNQVFAFPILHSRWLSLPILLFLGLLSAQERYSEVSGVVSDATGAVLPGVTVSITNKATDRVTTAVTDSNGAYIARSLEPGRYRVVFDRAGFNKFEVADLNLLLGRDLKVDAALQVGATNQAVQVSDSAPLIDVTGVAVSNNVTSEEFDRLPKARSFQSLALTSPSVNSGQVEGGFQINGASGAENQFVIDGISTNSLVDGRSRQNAAYEFLQEVQVKTGGIEAEYGGALGGVISAITKSGGNAFHGDLHYYFGGNRISAGPVPRLLLDPRDEQTVSYVQDYKSPLDTHEVGGSLGGYLRKNKLWFFTSYSPQFIRRTNTYLFSSGTERGDIEQKQTYQQLFNKVSFDPTQRIRMNLSWLWTPSHSEGTLPAYDFYGNGLSSSLAANEANRQIGWFSPQTSYTGQVDFTLTSTSLLTVRGGRFWDNYKDTQIPAISSVVYNTSATSLPFDIPASLRQPLGYFNTPRRQNSFHDLTSRTYVQVDYSKVITNLLGSHDLKVGVGTSKTVNNVDVGYPGEGYVLVNWDAAFREQRGAYGFYEVDNIGTRGTTGAGITSMYIQDRWRILPRLSLTLGLRTENEKVPSFQRNVRDYAFQFGFQDKLAPRLGASYDVFGNGRLKLYGSWGLYYDWVKYELSRGTFGGDYWTVRYRSLDTTDVFALSGTNTPGSNLWTSEFRNKRLPSFDAVDPNLKPMSTALTNVGVEYQLSSSTVFRGSYVRNNLRRTIEDLGALVNGDEAYYFANPGEGAATITPTSGTTKPFPTPKAKRTYDAMELTLTKRFSSRWFGSASYVLSRLYGNYAGLANSDEITPPTTGTSSATTQAPTGSVARPGSSASRAWDLDEIMFDSHGNLDVQGRLATDRPHVVKLYGSYLFKFGTELGGFYYGGSGTPLSTQVWTQNHVPVFVNGRGDLGRTPFLNQTDLMVAHEFKFTEARRLRFEFNAQNVFNQKTARHIFTSLNRGAGLDRPSAEMNLSGVDLRQGYDYRSLILQTSEGQHAFDPRFNYTDLFNPGFQGRFLVKFIF